MGHKCDYHTDVLDCNLEVIGELSKKEMTALRLWQLSELSEEWIKKGTEKKKREQRRVREISEKASPTMMVERDKI